uniref:Uncharacterized protein n=1 Tax=Arundo donax TaxID=35708 RepID=A0A0A9C2P4_ARUDO
MNRSPFKFLICFLLMNHWLSPFFYSEIDPCFEFLIYLLLMNHRLSPFCFGF